MRYKVVVHNIKSGKAAMENMLSELENTGWYLKSVSYAGGERIVTIHTDKAPREGIHAKLES